MEPENKKPQLHQSSISLLLRCGYKFSRVILNGEREPQTTPLVIGTGTHSTNAQNLQNKIDRGILLPRDVVTDMARDNFIRAWNETAVVLSDEEMFQGLQKSKDLAMDQTIECSKAYHYECAPKIEPISVEKKFVIEAQGYDFDFAGAIDCEEFKKIPDGQWGDIPIQGNIIRDTKTRKTNLGQQEVDRSNQYTFYALYEWLASGKTKVPDFVAQDSIIKGTKNRAAFCVTNYSRRTTDDFAVAFRIFDQACKIIKAGVFAPASPLDFLCNREYCGFAAQGTCKYFNSIRGATIKQTPNLKDEKFLDKGTILSNLKKTLEA
jgi:hypothetical protein